MMITNVGGVHVYQWASPAGAPVTPRVCVPCRFSAVREK